MTGPATSLKLEQNNDFFDSEANEIQTDQTNLEFIKKCFFIILITSTRLFD
jgi:hypothetical protein